MLFNSYLFIFLFLPAALFLFFVARSSHRKLQFLLAASIIFYAFWSFADAFILLTSIFTTFSVSFFISKCKSHQAANVGLFFGIASNLSLLIYFKYTDFLLAVIFGELTSASLGGIEYANPDLPLGISFFTFQQIGYLLLVHRRQVFVPTLVEYSTFVAFFPQLVAGPIADARHLLPQLKRFQTWKPKAFLMALAGFTIFSMGLFKKCILADNLGIFSDRYFDGASVGNDFSTLDAMFGATSYTFQLYFDFSGYSDMAIGLGLLFGIKLPLNFFSPLKSRNVMIFWRRWHITLGRFINETVFTPLTLFVFRKVPGSLKFQTANFNIIEFAPTVFVFSLLGLWHGAGLTFIIFGIWHGLGVYWCSLARNKDWFSLDLFSAVSLNFVFVVIGFLIFRAENVDTLFSFFESIRALDFFGTNQQDSIFTAYELMFFVSCGLIVFSFPSTSQIMARFIDLRGATYTIQLKNPKFYWRPTMLWAVFSAMLFAISISTLTTNKTFLYFQF